MVSRILSTREVSERTGLAESTLRYFRHRGDKGPKSWTLGRRAVYYEHDVDAWLDAQYAKAVGEELGS